MKKFIFLIAIAIGSMVCTAARAQTTKEAYKQELRTYMSVSYTHLDVYKRQVWSLSLPANMWVPSVV